MIITLPGDIPGLLRRGSPVLHGAGATVVIGITEAGIPSIGVATGVWGVMSSSLRLDLTDPTGRAHAAAWANALSGGSEVRRLSSSTDYEAWRMARDFEAMTPTQIDTLARLVLRLAGRTP